MHLLKCILSSPLKHMTQVHLTIQRTLMTKEILSVRYHYDITNGRNIDFWEGILTVKANGRVESLTDKPFFHQNSLVQPGGQDSH